MAPDYILAQLLHNNLQWAQRVEQTHPGFFQEHATHQEPKVLWIGCADSRVPESVITDLMPGVIFVHRNIANQFPPTDDNALSVLMYAVHELKVQHVIVVGHTDCGGVKWAHDAAHGTPPSPSPSPPPLAASPSTPLSRWLAPLVEVAQHTPGGLAELGEANVRAQVDNVCKAIEWRAREEGSTVHVNVHVHGWMYELAVGRLRDLGVSRTVVV